MALFREGPALVQGLYRTRRLYHSRAAHEEWAGTSRYRGHERRSEDRKQGGTVERTASPLNIIRGGAFCFAPRKAPLEKGGA